MLYVGTKYKTEHSSVIIHFNLIKFRMQILHYTTSEQETGPIENISSMVPKVTLSPPSPAISIVPTVNLENNVVNLLTRLLLIVPERPSQ